MPSNLTPYNKYSFLLIFHFFFGFIAYSQTNVKPKIPTAITYAGIEVGSKGVKMSILETSGNGFKSGNFKILKDTTVNTDFISFTDASFQATLKGLTGMYVTALNKFVIPSNHIFTLFSSGVKVIADKEKKSGEISKLADSFRLAINEPNRVINAIDVVDEAKLSHLGIVPLSKRYSTFLIDIGSGNTKGGYFPSGNINDFKLFQLTWGTKSVTNATEKRLEDDKSISNFNKNLYRVIAGSAEDEIIYAVNVSGAYNMSDNIAFSGGIAWATATLISPELADNAVIPVLYEDVLRFTEKIYNNYNSFSDTAVVANISDNTLDKSFIANEVKKVNKVFDQKALMAGSALLLKIMRQFESVYEKKQFFLVKNGQVGWISAYVNQITAQ
jgi:hypothetical protein